MRKQFLAIFELDGFYGSIKPINDPKHNNTLYHEALDKTYLTDHLDLRDENGSLRPESECNDDELLTIIKNNTWASNVHLVDSLDALRALSTNAKYQKHLCKPFLQGFAQN